MSAANFVWTQDSSPIMCAFRKPLQNVLGTYYRFDKRAQGPIYRCYDLDPTEFHQRELILVFAAKVPSDPIAYILMVNRIEPVHGPHLAVGVSPFLYQRHKAISFMGIKHFSVWPRLADTITQ
jgi:hypothetical protein